MKYLILVPADIAQLQKELNYFASVEGYKLLFIDPKTGWYILGKEEE